MAPGDTPAPGWYDDPADDQMARWWDGEQWSNRIRPKNASPAAPPHASYGAPPGQTMGGGVPTGLPPSNYLPQAILTTLFCCLPFGVVSIVKASQVNSLWQTGQQDAAYAASQDAKRWAWISFGVGLAAIALFILIGIIGGLSDSSSGY